MAEEDEIDVLGEFNLDTFLVKSDSNLYESTSLVSQNTELLNCDYTIHPQWLLDKPSANPDNWYDTNSSTSSLEKIIEPESLGHVSTENSITDESGWTEKEKNLLDRGIEIFGKSTMRLSQFIGSKTSAEVKYYLKNFYSDCHNTSTLNDGLYNEPNNSNLICDVLNDTQIPASIEEVIEAVSTAKPTIQIHKCRKKSSSSSDFCDLNLKDVSSGQSLLKTNYRKKNNLQNLQNRSKSQLMTFKMKAKSKILKEMKSPKSQRNIVTLEKPEVSKVEITTGQGLAVPFCEGEEIVKIRKIDDESDVDIEVDVEDSDEEYKITPKPSNSFFNANNLQVENKGHIKNCDIEKPEENSKNFIDLSTVEESTIKELMSLEEPKHEIKMDENKITELEKVIHYEFFEGRPAKTPLRYMKIRNHIINVWISQKPLYVTKTSIRQGLKNCGDVNCIGRIHYFLEQIGAINFGCEQMNYSRPLYNMLQPSPVTKDKSFKEINRTVGRPLSILGNRPRYKRKLNNDGEGGCTLTHDEAGHVINTTVVNEVSKQRLYIKKPTVRLVYCRSFTEEKPMDFHAHTSLTEVMGLIGGYWQPIEQLLIINWYVPCLNIASSATHCDMCPISQAKAADLIHSKGLDVLGWFHSHPTFAPEPSHQDIETQQSLQQWLGHNKPCVGFILSPFSLSGALIASPFRCMVVDKKLNFEDQMVPYKFKVGLLSEGFTVEEFLIDIKEVCETYFKNSNGNRVKFNKPYFQNPNITYLEKYISSVRMHLAKCGTLHKMTCDEIIQGITQICSKSDR